MVFHKVSMLFEYLWVKSCPSFNLKIPIWFSIKPYTCTYHINHLKNNLAKFNSKTFTRIFRKISEFSLDKYIKASTLIYNVEKITVITKSGWTLDILRKLKKQKQE